MNMPMKMNYENSNLYFLIGTRLRDKRIEQNKTQEEVATELDISRTSVTNIESGSQKLPVHLIYSYCDLLNIEISSILPTLKELQETRNLKVHGLMTDNVSNLIDNIAKGDLD